MKFDVLLYPVCTVKVKDVEADDPLDAFRKAEAPLDLYRLLKQNNPDQGVAFVEYSDEIAGYIVDRVVGADAKGDPILEEAGWFYGDETEQNVTRDRTKQHDRELLAVCRECLAYFDQRTESDENALQLASKLRCLIATIDGQPADDNSRQS